MASVQHTFYRVLWLQPRKNTGRDLNKVQSDVALYLMPKNEACKENNIQALANPWLFYFVNSFQWKPGLGWHMTSTWSLRNLNWTPWSECNNGLLNACKGFISTGREVIWIPLSWTNLLSYHSWTIVKRIWDKRFNSKKKSLSAVVYDNVQFLR